MRTWLGKLLYFVLVVIIACLLAWAVNEIVGVLAFIPEAIKHVVYVVTWVLAIVAIIYAAWYLLASSLPPVPGP